uniref:tetratricopeptide repeat protein n=1 Tax=Cyanobium sp. TaxID=2164130 RepID=UPI0040487FBA
MLDPISAIKNPQALLETAAQTTDQATLLELRRFASGQQGDPWVLAQGFVFWKLGESSKLIELLIAKQENLRTTPQYWLLLGLAYREQSLDDLARSCYSRALQLDDRRSDIHYNLANILQSDNSILAEHHYSIALALDPMHHACLHNLAMLYLGQDFFDKAEILLKRALCIDPLNSQAWCNLGLCMFNQDHYFSAEKCFLLAMALNPRHSQSCVNLGSLFVSDSKPEIALPLLEQGVKLNPASNDALFNLGICHLLLGRYETGWNYYQSRLQTKLIPESSIPVKGPIPSTLSELRSCPRLVVWTEQGSGDTIQFCRYLLLLDQLAINYVFYCPPTMVSLMKEWLSPSGLVCPFPRSSDPPLTGPNVPLMNMPHLFSTSMSTIPSVLPYLSPPSPPPPSLCVPEPPGGIAIGLAWASNPDNKAMYRHKSLQLKLLMPLLLRLLDLDLADIHVLQVGVDNQQLDPWRGHPRIFDWQPQLKTFGDTAHVVQQLDLVITVDTALAHLSAALRRPTWVMLPANADFRWLLDRDDSPWYPGIIRLFRQETRGEWFSVLNNLQAALDELFMVDLESLLSSRQNS